SLLTADLAAPLAPARRARVSAGRAPAPPGGPRDRPPRAPTRRRRPRRPSRRGASSRAAASGAQRTRFQLRRPSAPRRGTWIDVTPRHRASQVQRHVGRLTRRRPFRILSEHPTCAPKDKRQDQEAVDKQIIVVLTSL